MDKFRGKFVPPLHRLNKISSDVLQRMEAQCRSRKCNRPTENCRKCIFGVIAYPKEAKDKAEEIFLDWETREYGERQQDD
jgi:hypothetical protein